MIIRSATTPFATKESQTGATRKTSGGTSRRRAVFGGGSTGLILRFAALQLGADAETIHAYACRQQTVSEHQQRIGEYLRLGAFDAAVGERLARFFEDEALRLERTASLLARARAWLRDEHVLAPADSVLRSATGADRLDDDQPHSPLNRIKASSSSPSVGGMKRLLARLELIRRA